MCVLIVDSVAVGVCVGLVQCEINTLTSPSVFHHLTMHLLHAQREELSLLERYVRSAPWKTSASVSSKVQTDSLRPIP